MKKVTGNAGWMRWIRTGSRVAIAGVIMCCAHAAVAAPFQNGSFEDGPVQPTCNIFNIPVGDDTTITGWTVIEGNIDWEGPPPCGWLAAAGNNSLDLVGNQTKGGVEQTFDTIPGVTYRVSFELAGNYGVPPVIKPLTVTVAGDTHNYEFDTTGASQFDMKWTTKTFTFVAQSTSETIDFVSDLSSNPGPGNGGAALDNVQIAPASRFATAAPTLGVPGLVVTALLLLLLGTQLLRRKKIF